LVLKDVPRTVFEERNSMLPFIVHGLLQHEHKQSVLHFVVQRNTEYEEPVKAKVSGTFPSPSRPVPVPIPIPGAAVLVPVPSSPSSEALVPPSPKSRLTVAQDPLVLCVGPRRYVIRPLYSQHVRGGGRGVNNVHKSEKFLRPGSATVATTYGPVCFGKTACILLKEEGEDQGGFALDGIIRIPGL
jgi:pre-rRNA-processing protein TSR1